MADYFTPPSRSSKRRKLGTYGDGANRTTIEGQDSATQKASTKKDAADTPSRSSRKSRSSKYAPVAEESDAPNVMGQEESLDEQDSAPGSKDEHPKQDQAPKVRQTRSRPPVEDGSPHQPEASSARSTRSGKQATKLQQAREAMNKREEKEKLDRSSKRVRRRAQEGSEDATAPSMYESIVSGETELYHPEREVKNQKAKGTQMSSDAETEKRISRNLQRAEEELDKEVQGQDAMAESVRDESQQDSDVTDAQTPSRTTRRARTKRAPEVNEDEEHGPRTAAASSGTPSKQKLEQQPKSILTPSRRDRDTTNGTRKSVLFDDQQKVIEQELGFKDISSSKRKTRKSPQRRQKASVMDEQDKLEVENDISLGREPGEDDEAADGGLRQATPDEIHPSFEAITEDSNLYTDVAQVDEDPQLCSIKQTILSRLVSRRPTPSALNLQAQYDSLHSLLTATVTAGESNSLLLLGSRGSGKSLLIDTARTDLFHAHGPDFHVVRLNGFFQTDDKLALREIWRQLGREMRVSEDETGEVSSYADTMASLLSLLSLPEEFEADGEGGEANGQTVAKSVIFILDEFDLFTTHPRQTLLYNLFDIAQSRKAPIAVIGCSTRMDVVDCLEKRVKSRFSHRWLHVPRSKNLKEIEDTLKSILSVDDTGKDAIGLTEEDLIWRKTWNDHISSSFLPSPQVQALITQTFHSSKSLPTILTALYIPIATLTLPPPTSTTSPPSSSSSPKLKFPLLIPQTSPPSIVTLLPTLPLLHLSLLVSATRLHTIHSLPTISFSITYKHYIDLIQRSKLNSSSSLRQWGEKVARQAWEELGEMELIVPAAGAGEGAGRDVAGGVGAWKCDVGLEEVGWALKEKGRNGEGSGVEGWERWCREV